jgi:hypothetical protein
MEMNVGVASDPMIPFRFMSLEVVHNYMDFLLRMLPNDLVHETQKLPAAAPPIMACLYLSGGYIQGRKKRTCPMPSTFRS